MSWRLMEEVAWKRPARPGPEWWVLLDIAEQARDDTRQAWPGEEFLMRRAKCSRATLYRRIDALVQAGFIKVVKSAGYRSRTVYELLPLYTDSAEVTATVLGSRHAATQDAATECGLASHVAETQAENLVSQNHELGSQKPELGSHSDAETPPVNPPVTLPSASKTSVLNGSVESAAAGVRDEDHFQGSLLVGVTGGAAPGAPWPGRRNRWRDDRLTATEQADKSRQLRAEAERSAAS